MRSNSEKLYSSLIGDLKNCRSKSLPFLIESECCFRTSIRYWAQIQQELKKHDFPSIEDEILFFKEIKPKFVGEIEYYSLLNYSENTSPGVAFIKEQKNFWTQQMNRLEKFKVKHTAFWAYYVSAKADEDKIYYTRATPDDPAYVYDKAASGYDELMGYLFALQRYALYAASKLKDILEKL